jgi:hypothetical protein
MTGWSNALRCHQENRTKGICKEAQVRILADLMEIMIYYYLEISKSSSQYASMQLTYPNLPSNRVATVTTTSLACHRCQRQIFFFSWRPWVTLLWDDNADLICIVSAILPSPPDKLLVSMEDRVLDTSNTWQCTQTIHFWWLRFLSEKTTI